MLQKADVPGTNLEVIYATVEIVPGFKAGRHTHPGVVMAQVVEGEFWFAPDGQPEKIFKAGEVADRARPRHPQRGRDRQGRRSSTRFTWSRRASRWRRPAK